MTGACMRGSFDQSYYGSFMAEDPDGEKAIISEDGTELAAEDEEDAFHVWTFGADGVVYGTMSDRGVDFLAVYEPATGEDPRMRQNEGLVLIPRAVSGNGIAHFAPSGSEQILMLKRQP